MLALLVVLMACVFSTLDNAVTLRHASGTDIGQWPRLLLAFSGLAAGFVFDIRKRKYMGLIMYCVMMMSVLSIVVLNLGAPFLIGLVVFLPVLGLFRCLLYSELYGAFPAYAPAVAVGGHGPRHE